MGSVRDLIASYFPSSGDELHMGGMSVSAIAQACGTPLFIYDRAVLDRKWELLRAALPPEFSIFYSVKANPNQKILRHFLEKGAGLEIASGGEFCQALAAGCQPDNILFAGPGKSEDELSLVIGKGIGEIHVESQREAERIVSISRRFNVQTHVALRVNPAGDAEGGAMRMGGRPAPFGIDEENLSEVLDFLLKAPEVILGGIHIFSGTQILDTEVLLRQYRRGIAIARQVVVRLGRPLRRVDFGGGLGVPYFAHENPLDLNQLRPELDALLQEIRHDSAFSATRFLVEPGRFLTAEAGVYISRVSDVKVSRGKKFVIVDGGMHHHLAASGNLGQTIKRNYPIAVLNKLAAPEAETVDVVGPLCTPLDVLARGVSLPAVAVGDLIGVFQSGAYARAASPLNFLSHRTPPEVWADSGRFELIRKRGDYSDSLRDLCQTEVESLSR
ncbi:MAG TPA: type III PLP-dependent enzyme [Candidatus Acidoferrales bacterium]|nr:type III PLP-dependent enzyme [Candidatus Acidoferrales bacterium]